MATNRRASLAINGRYAPPQPLPSDDPATICPPGSAFLSGPPAISEAHSAASSVDAVMAELQAVYRVHDPSKLDRLPELITVYRGRDGEHVAAKLRTQLQHALYKWAVPDDWRQSAAYGFAPTVERPCVELAGLSRRWPRAVGQPQH